jgi:hypothetical protein
MGVVSVETKSSESFLGRARRAVASTGKKQT